MVKNGKESDLYIVILLCGVIDASSENDNAYKYTTESKCFVVVKAKDYSYEMSDILSLYAFASCFRFYFC